MKHACEMEYATHIHRLQLLEQRLKAVDPDLLLQRGYSITLREGKILTDASALVPGDRIVTRMKGGIVKSKVQEINLEGQDL